jgi:hypothetical protein
MVVAVVPVPVRSISIGTACLVPARVRALGAASATTAGSAAGFVLGALSAPAGAKQKAAVLR